MSNQILQNSHSDDSHGRPLLASTALRWFAVNTQPSAELKACMHLRNQGWQVFNPLLARSVRSARRSRNVLRPLFPGYIFVNLDTGVHQWRSVDGTIGVRCLVKAGDMPLPVPKGIVETLQSMTLENGQFVFKSTLRPGDKVRFLTGPFSELVGTLEHMSDRGRVQVMLSLLGRQTQVITNSEALQPIG